MRRASPSLRASVVVHRHPHGRRRRHSRVTKATNCVGRIPVPMGASRRRRPPCSMPPRAVD
ncbi:unnamed protein product, partial [Musa textilis]